jgi:glycosyltransferase involved in cell wall biosynthesis
MKSVSEWASNCWEKPAVSVVCWSFNHYQFLTQAIESILIQRTEFPVEIIIHDDASKDGTQSIIQSYALKYPKIIIPILQSTNQFSKGLDINLPAYNKTSANYIALCEGDDFWTNQFKLQYQFEYLNSNQNVAGVFHRGFAVNSIGKRIPFVWDNILFKNVYSQYECIFELLSGYPTASLCFNKKHLALPFPQYFSEHPTDYMFDILLTESGPLGYLDFEGCAYRQHSGGIWSTLSLIDIQMENAKRSASLYRDNHLRKKYPKLQNHFLHQLDVLWWLMYKNYNRGLFAANMSLIKMLFALWKKNKIAFIKWICRKDCPFIYKAKRDFMNFRY